MKTVRPPRRYSPAGCCDMIKQIFDKHTVGETPPDRALVERECVKLGIYRPTIQTQYNVNLNRFKRLHFDRNEE
jgi:hypothetical protein